MPAQSGRTTKLATATPRRPDAPSNLPREQLRAAKAHLWSIALHLDRAGVLGPKDLGRVKFALKQGRGTRATPEAVRAATHICLTMASELASQHPTAPDPRTAPPKATEQKRRRHHREMPPPAGGPTHTQPEQEKAGSISLAVIGDQEEKLDTLAERRSLVRLMDEGLSARQAIAKLGLPENRMWWAYKTYQRWRKDQAIVDRRWTRKSKRTVLGAETEQLILQLWNSYPGAKAKNIHNLLQQEITRRQHEATARGEPSELLVPSYQSVWRYLNQLPECIKVARGGRMDAWDKQARATVRRGETHYANQIAQADHTPLGVWVRVEVAPDEWMPAPVWLTTVLDLHSRALLGYILSTRHPDAWTIALATRQAVLPKEDPRWPMHGKPERLIFDRGRDFKAHAVKRRLDALGIEVEFCAPHNPDEKPEQERFFLTLKSRIRELQCAMANIGKSEGAALKKMHLLLTLPQLRAEVHRFICEYHETEHRSTGEAPATLWTETARVRPVNPHEMDILLLNDDHIRIVTKEGLRFTPPGGRGGLYRARELHDHWRQEVRIRYNPEDEISLLVYAADSGQFICEAWLAGAEGSRYTDAQVLVDRKATRAGIVSRTREYVRKTVEEDRPRKRKEAREEQLQREAAARAAEKQAAQTPEEGERARTKEMLRARFKRDDRSPEGQGND